MGFISTIFNTILYQPLLNILVLLYEYIPGNDFGVAIIILTIIIKLIFYPLGSKAIKSQKALAEIQPKIKEIQEKYKDNKEEQARQMMALYKKEEINPLSGCLPLLIQLPVLIALYRVFWMGLDPNQLSLLYGFVPKPEAINSMFLGFLDLSKPSIALAVLVGAAQFFQMKLIAKKDDKSKKAQDFSTQMQKQMQYFMPMFMILILWSLPSALGLYLLTTTLFTIAQQYFTFKKEKTYAESR